MSDIRFNLTVNACRAILREAVETILVLAGGDEEVALVLLRDEIKRVPQVQHDRRKAARELVDAVPAATGR